MAQPRPMPPKYKRRTPIPERVYKSSPVMVQSKLPRLRSVGPVIASTPSSSERQATLTQMDFATPRQFARDAEIPNSDDDEDEFEEPPPKRARTRGMETDGRVSSTPGLTKQSTLTQMDWARMQEIIQDSDDDEEDIYGAEIPLNQNENRSRPTFFVKSEHPIEDISSEPAARSRQSSVREFDDENIEARQRSSALPETPKKLREQTIPSSQTPSATPISIPNSRHRTSAQAKHADAAADSPTPSSSRRSFDLAHTPSGSRSLTANKKSSSARHNSPTSKAVHSTKSLNPPNMAPPALPAHPVNSETPLKPRSQNTVPQVPAEWLRTQSQTQTTPRTKQKVMDFNNRWALLTGNPNDVPKKNWTPKLKDGQVVQAPAHTSFSIGDLTQAELLQIEMEEPSGQDVGEENNADEGVLANEAALQNGTKGKAIVIQSSQDDECHSDSSQLTRPEQDDDCIGESAKIENESLVPASSPIVPGFAQIPRSHLAASSSHVIPDTQNRILGSNFPTLGGIRSSQASTTAGTPDSIDVTVIPPTARIPATSPDIFDRNQAPHLLDDSLPAFANGVFDGGDMLGTSPIRGVTVSQLIPSSLMESVPRPHSHDFETQEEFEAWYDDDDRGEDEL